MTADAVVVGGFREKDGGGAQGTDGDVGGTAADALVDSVAGAFERAGLSVGRASGRAARHRRQLADALFAAVRDGVRQDVNRPRRPKVVAIVGLGGESGSIRSQVSNDAYAPLSRCGWRARARAEAPTEASTRVEDFEQNQRRRGTPRRASGDATSRKPDISRSPPAASA